MSERDADVAAEREDALFNDTVPETPALEPASEEKRASREPSMSNGPTGVSGVSDEPQADEGREAEDTHERSDESDEPDEASASGSDLDEPLTEPSASLAPQLQESPERADRRVSAGWRVGTRVTLALVGASVLPTAAVTAAVLFGGDNGALRAQIALGAFALSLVLSALVGLRLRSELSKTLSSLEARLRLLASGQPSARYPGSQPAELHALDDVADLLSDTLGTLREREAADRERSERLFALAERVDAIARGQLSTRLPPTDDVAEASLAASMNRLVDAFERRVVRLKSHARLLAAEGGSVPPPFDEGEDDPVALVEKRVGGLRPIPPLLQDIAGRLATLSRMPRGEARVSDDLARLAEAIAQRARAAQALFDSLEAQLPRLPRGPDSTARGLTSDQQRALAALGEDLDELTVDASLPRLVESLPDLSIEDVRSRLARPKVDA